MTQRQLQTTQYMRLAQIYVFALMINTSGIVLNVVSTHFCLVSLKSKNHCSMVQTMVR